MKQISRFAIIFLNKIFSTIKNNNQVENFFRYFKLTLSTLKNGAIIIFNDVNLHQKGREDFLNYMKNESDFLLLGTYFFPIDNAYTGNYT